MLPIKEFKFNNNNNKLILYFNGCNLSCPFCYFKNYIEISEEAKSFEEILEFIKNNNIKELILTGGEPLLHENLIGFLSQIRKQKIIVKLKTNGFYSSKLKYILNEWLVDFVSLSIKSSSFNYEKSSGKDNINFDLIISSISLLMNWAGEHEFKIVPIPEFIDNEDIQQLSKLLADARKIVIQQFCNKDILSPNIIKREYSIKELEKIAETFSFTNVTVKKSNL